MPILLQIFQSAEDMVWTQALLQWQSWQKGPLLLQGGRVFNEWSSLSSYEEFECSHVERPWLERTACLRYWWSGGWPTALWVMTPLMTHSTAWSVWQKGLVGTGLVTSRVTTRCSRPWWPVWWEFTHIYGQCVSFLVLCPFLYFACLFKNFYHVCLMMWSPS